MMDSKFTRYELCPSVKKGEMCRYGQKCHFAYHSEKFSDSSNKSSKRYGVCPSVFRGDGCFRGEGCHFVYHTTEVPGIYMKWLPAWYNEKEIQHLAEQYGDIMHVRCFASVNGTTMTATVYYRTIEQARQAIQNLHGSNVSGYTLNVSLTKGTREKEEKELIITAKPLPPSPPTRIKFTPAQRLQVWNRFYGDAGKAKCHRCKIVEIYQLSFEMGHDHALAKGGTNDLRNIEPVCRTCNMSQGTQTFNQFQATLLPMKQTQRLYTVTTKEIPYNDGSFSGPIG